MLKKVLLVIMTTTMIGCQTQTTDVSTEIKEELIETETKEEITTEESKIKTVTITTDKIIKSKTNKPHYNKNNILEISNVSNSKLQSELKSTGLSGLEGAFIKAEEKYKINALVLVSILALESGWGRSSRAINDNNLSGYAIYNRGSSYSFASKEDCIIETARLIKEDYLTPGGKYYNGTSLQDVNKKYCASSDWHLKVDQIARRLK